MTAVSQDTQTRPVLVADLDGTLLKSDMLHETFWAAVSDNPRAISGSLRALGDGRAALKAYLAGRTQIDPATLPYDDRIIARLTAWRDQGGRTALVTASDDRLAQSIAAHLAVFDDVQGSRPDQNLKGPEKAAHLTERYGQGGYIYMGDSSADLPVWANGAEAISIGASASVQRQLDAAEQPAEHLPPAGNPAAALIRALRPHQWLKNILVLVPLIAAQAFTGAALWAVLVAFIALSVSASAGYVLNDLLDLNDDRSHPRKRSRPFAAGDLSARTGTLLVPALLLFGLGLALAQSLPLFGVVLGYFILTTAYSVKLKRHSMVDIVTLAVLFTLRVIAGGMAIGYPISVWLLAFSMFLFFSLAAVKRLAELTDTDAADRSSSRRGYRSEDRAVISQMSVTSGYLAVLVFALYIDQPVVRETFGAPWMLWGVCPLLIFWVSRMALVASRGEMHDDPLVWALRNKTSRKVMILSVLMITGAVLL